MPCLGKPETWEQTAWSPEGSRKRLGRKGGPPQAWPHWCQDAPGRGWGGVPVSAEEGGLRAERQVTSGHVGVWRGPAT